MLRSTEIKKEIAERLKFAREKAGYSSPADFCHATQLPLKTYLLHEQGEVSLTASQAQKYSRLLTISMGWLLLGPASIRVKDEIHSKQRKRRSGSPLAPNI